MAVSENAIRIAYPLVVVLMVLSGLHFYWALGGMWGLAASLGRQAVEPNRLIRGGAGAVGIALAIAAAVVLGRVGVWKSSLPWLLFLWGAWGLAGALALAGVINLTAQTWWERLAFAPLAFVLAAMALAVARSTQP